MRDDEAMPKAERRFALVRQKGSHAQFRRHDGRLATFAYHDRVELSDSQLRDVVEAFGITLLELKQLL